MEQSKFYQIKNITEHEYTLVGCDGSVITRPIRDIDESASAFTISDAKEGDVLVASDGSLFIFAYVKDNSVYYHFALSKDGIKQISDGRHAWETASSCHPATKEQRDQLEKAMTDTGYRWDKDEKRLICLKKENSNDSDLEWSNMETKECHCYSCELYDWKNNNCRNYKLCKNPKNTYKGFYKKSLKKSIKEDRKAIRNKIAHEIAWESTKHYDPALSKKSWCEMAVREAIDRVSGEYSDNYMQGYKDAVKDACEWLNDRYRDYGYLDLEDITTMMQELEKIK